MSDILCVYYSRTGVTRTAMQEVAEALNAECVEITDGIDRGGSLGFFMCGIDAMRRGTHRTQPYTTEKPLGDYKMVILGTPVWAGRCSSVIRGFLKRHGLELQRVSYLLTRASNEEHREVFEQMDRYTAAPHMAAISLRPGAVGYHFWRDQFLTDVRNAVAGIGKLPPTDMTVINYIPTLEERRRHRSKKKNGQGTGRE